MKLLSLILFAVVAIVPLLQLARRPERFAQFPAASAAVWAAYILPQAIGIYLNPIYLPRQVFDDGFAATMFMCTLCAVAGYAGHALGGRSHPRRPPTPVSPERLWGVGLVCGCLAAWFALRLVTLSGGFLVFFSVHGNYSLNWTGLSVRYNVLLYAFLSPAIMLVLASFLLRPSPSKFLALGGLLLWPLASIIFLGRRLAFVSLLPAAISFHFVKGWYPSRRLLVAGLLVLTAVVFVFPKYRKYSEIGANHQQLESIDVADTVGGVFQGSEQKEFNNSIGLIATARKTGHYMLGAHQYNVFVAKLVPRQLVGADFKNSLYIGKHLEYDDLSEEVYGWRRAPWQSMSGPEQVFIDFWYLGALVFFAIGYVSRRLYDRAARGSVSSQIVYALLWPLVPEGIAIGFARFPRQLLFIAMFAVPLLLFARHPPVRGPRVYRSSKERPDIGGA